MSFFRFFPGGDGGIGRIGDAAILNPHPQQHNIYSALRIVLYRGFSLMFSRIK